MPQFIGMTKAAGATGLFDLNLVSSTLGDQLAMLHAAQADGLPVKRVELGNELWAWQYRGLFADGAVYARVANTWIATLHREFPGVEIAVPVNDPTSAKGPRGKLWNKELFATIRGADAAALHVYLQAADSTPAEVATAPLTQWSAALRRITPSLPTNIPIWVTEWNYTPAEAQQPLPWARAIGGAELAVRMVEDPRVDLADFHDLVGFVGSSYAAIRAISTNGSSAGPFRYYLTAAGRMLQLLVGTLSGCQSVQAVGTSSVTRHATAPQLVGVACREPAPVRVMVINPTSKSVLVNTTAIVGRATHVVTSVSTIATSSSDAAPAGVRARSSGGVVRVPPWGLLTLES
ncbi:hypothetical protein [Leekyejoonella antrihumi]|uniref:Asl1-like glycosyl hydrolase catalytic domain-containing protein n=1 Tax=Leekyejoonella antrihumi TaxID=1660198 RepID=A0A563DTJ1_9MICO|nr:hypothetical protein [Leekyejoonella antrihumi]TWP33489.1 hypothetical protein FGL98_21255 [Leekyejoonella antrihumi]